MFVFMLLIAGTLNFVSISVKATDTFAAYSTVADGELYNQYSIESTYEDSEQARRDAYQIAHNENFGSRDIDTSALNLGMGIGSILIGLITLLVASLSKHDQMYDE